MQVKYHRRFLKNYRYRIVSNKKLVIRFKQRLSLRLSDPENVVLRDHQLVGKKSQYRSFSVTGDIRVVYILEKDGYSPLRHRYSQSGLLKIIF